jgi:hypothetical protein
VQFESFTDDLGPRLLGRSLWSSWDWDKVRLYIPPHVGGERPFRQHMRLAAQKNLEFELDPSKVEQRRSRWRLDQDVEVAFLGGIASCGRPE